MIVAGLLAALLTYSVLREADGTPTTVLVASGAIQAGETVSASSFGRATLKGSPSASLGLLAPSAAASLAGEVATVAVPAGQAVHRSDFAPAAPAPPSMAIPISVQDLPGGVSGVVPGDLVDVLGTSPSGTSTVVPGLRVLLPPQAPSAQVLAAGTDTVDIVVAVPATTESALAQTLLAGKYTVRVSPPSS